MKRLGINILLGMILSVFVITVVNAGEAQEDVTMETVVVTGTRTEQQIERIPANVTVIDQEDIENSNAKNVVDLLRSEEGIAVRDPFGNGKTAQVDMRGFGETGPYNSAVLVDGRRVNEIDLSGIDWSQIPLDQIERVEILRGTGTVLYGDNAVGGVINIITKTPSKELKYNAEVIAGSYGRNKERVAISGGTDKIAASLLASYDSTNGYRDNSEFRTKDISGKIVYDLTDVFCLDVNAGYHSDNYGLPGDLLATEDRRSSNEPYNEAEIRDRYIDTGAELDLGRYGTVITNISYRDRSNESRFVGGFGTFVLSSDIDTTGITPRYILNKELFGHENRLIVGIDIYMIDQDAFSGPPGLPTGLTRVEKDSYGIYFNNEFSILNNLILSFGARRERVKYDLKQRDLTGVNPPLDERVTDRLNAYSAGLTFLYAGKSSIFIRANRSFRFPLTDELLEIDQFTFENRLNADLKPQKGKHYELGIRHYITPEIQGSVTLFHAKIKDEIFLDPTPAPFWGVNTNHPETSHEGIEIGCRAELWDKLTIFGNYTYERARFEKDPFKNNDIPAVPRHKGNLGLRLHDFVKGLIFSSDYNFVSSSHAISDQDNNALGDLDKYYAINARISYEWRWIESFVGVNNLTNKEYSEYAVRGFGGTVNYYPAPERNWVAGLKVAF